MGNAEQGAAFSLFDGIRELLAEAKILYSLVYQLSGLLQASDLNIAGSDTIPCTRSSWARSVRIWRTTPNQSKNSLRRSV